MRQYEYPEELFCGRCGKFVRPQLVIKTEQIVIDGIDGSADYTEADCPECGIMLCDRDKFMIPIRLGENKEKNFSKNT